MIRAGLIGLIFAFLAYGQQAQPGGGGGSGGGSGTVTSITAGCGLSGGTITASGTIAETTATVAHNGSYAILTGDCGKSLTTNTAAAWTLSQAGTTGFAAGWFVIVNNVGSGSLTITATTSTFYGGPTANISSSVLTVPTNSSVTFASDGTNYQVLASNGVAPGTVTSVTIAGNSNEITATGTCTGTTIISCTISIPSAFQLPGTIDGLTITTTTGTFTLANAKTLTVSNTMTFTATDSSTVAFGAGGTVWYAATTATQCNGTTQFPLGFSAGGNSCTNWPTFNQSTTGNAGSATNVAGGTANEIPYQTGAGATSFIAECASGVYVTNGSDVPSCGTAIPGGVTATTQTTGDNTTKLATDAFVVATAAPISVTGANFPGCASPAPAFSATPTFSLAAASNQSPCRIEPGVMTANVTSVTFTNVTAGAKFSIAWTEPSGGGYGVTYGGSTTNTCIISQAANIVTTQQFEVGNDGSTVKGTGCSSTETGVTRGPEASAPGTPASGQGACWWDSTNHVWSCKDNNSSTVSNVVVPQTCLNQVITAISAGGVITCAGVTYVNAIQQTTTITTGATATLSTAFTVNEEATAATAITYTLPTAAANASYCVVNGNNGSAADTGTLEVATSASGQYIVFTDGTLSASGGYVISGGAARDGACFVGIDTTHWMFYPNSPSGGTWAKH